jgi:hypothetical protein
MRWATSNGARGSAISLVNAARRGTPAQ